MQSASQKTVTEPQIDISTQPSPSSDKLDREFWLLRRLSQIAFKAGFTEVTRDELERACSPKDFKRQGAVSYVNPKDYDVIRFWIRGVHPQLLRVLPTASETTACGDTGSGALRRTSSYISCLFRTLKQVGGRITYGSKRLLSRLLGSAGGRKYAFSCKPTDPFFTNVLLAVRRKQDNRLHLKFFEHVPASKSSSRSTYTDNLVYLLPELRFRPLTTSGRLIVSASLFTALGCLGLVAPLAWLLTSNPDLVIAWSVAASAGAGATTSLVWARYWRAQAHMAEWFKLLVSMCFVSFLSAFVLISFSLLLHC
ncbi:hypothetical protein AHF37_10905 [Paragonimus kellicotti]|nr:hypothetical protein AHF37_10905 [Paragonimus kellicotti]